MLPVSNMAFHHAVVDFTSTQTGTYTIRLYSSPAETVTLARPVTDSLFVLGFRREARESKLPINVGIHEPSQDGEKVKNTLIWIHAERLRIDIRKCTCSMVTYKVVLP